MGGDDVLQLVSGAVVITLQDRIPTDQVSVLVKVGLMGESLTFVLQLESEASMLVLQVSVLVKGDLMGRGLPFSWSPRRLWYLKIMMFKKVEVLVLGFK